MFKAVAFVAAVLGLVVAAPSAIAVPVNKCVVNGTVTYQSDPCPGGQPRKQPSLQELNAQEQNRRKAAVATTAKSPANDRVATIAPASANQGDAVVSVPAAPALPAFHCDGRKHCSQMHSCAEAKYFLANCPGVEMDGDRDGIPCERQWCNR